MIREEDKYLYVLLVQQYKVISRRKNIWYYFLQSESLSLIFHSLRFSRVSTKTM